MSINTDVTVIVVTYNSAHCIARLAEGLQHHDSIVFVDNASADDTVVQINKHLPHAIVIAQKRNLGFGAANNAALAQVKTPYVWFFGALFTLFDFMLTDQTIDF